MDPSSPTILRQRYERHGYEGQGGGVSELRRDGKREVVLTGRLRPALQRLNPDLPVAAIEGALEELCRDRTALSLAEANREIDKLLKPGVNVREGFFQDLRDYKQTIPQLFHYNALLLVSNGVQSKIGSLTAEWEHFGDWKKATSEEDDAAISLATLLRGTCQQGRLLDLVENFTRFSDSKGAVSKLLARNHQFIGVNRAVAALVRICESEGKIAGFGGSK